MRHQILLSTLHTLRIVVTLNKKETRQVTWFFDSKIDVPQVRQIIEIKKTFILFTYLIMAKLL